MFWNLVKKIDQNKISAEEARNVYDNIFDELDEEQQELLENKIAELEEEEHYWELTKKITSKDFYDDNEEAVEDQLQEYDEYPFDEEESLEEPEKD